MDRYKVKLTFTEPILGTVPKDPEVYRQHVQSKAADLGDELAAQEISTIERVEEKGWTGFHKEDGQPILYDYVIKGYFKDACGMLRRATGTKSAKVKAYKKVIDGLVFVSPRQIPLVLPAGESLGTLERPLRAQTAQGERIALARSDTCPAGTTLEFTLNVLGAVGENLLREWLDYGELRGLGQWRNAGWGNFRYTLVKAT